MKLTRNQIEKIDLYLGLSKLTVEKIKYWISLNPKDPFDADEFISGYEWIRDEEIPM